MRITKHRCPRWALTIALLANGAVALPTPAHADDATGSRVTMVSESGDDVGHGGTPLWRVASDRIQVGFFGAHDAAGADSPLDIAGPPAPVTALQVSADDGDVVTVQWSPSPSADVISTVVRGAAGPSAPATASEGFALTVSGNTAVTPELEVSGPFSFSVFAVDVGGAMSPPASITINDSAVSIATSTTALTFGKVVTFSGAVTDRRTALPIPNATVTLIAARPGQEDYVAARTVTADAGGRWTTKLDPQISYKYFAIAHSKGDHLGGASPLRVVTVAKLVIVEVVSKKVKHGRSGQLVAAVGPPVRGTSVVLQRLVNGKWTKVMTAKVGRDGTTLLTFKLKKKGVYTYRITTPADADNKAGTSKKVKITAT